VPRRKRAALLALRREDPPALRRVRLAGVLTGDEPARAVVLPGEEADLRVDVEAGRVVGARRDHALVAERGGGLVGVEVVALPVEDDRGPARSLARGAARQRGQEADT